MRDGFVKIAAASPDLRPADPAFNADGIIKLARRAYDDGATIILFPELSIPGYTSADLFFQKTLQRASDSALDSILAATSSMDALVVVAAFQPEGKVPVLHVKMHARANQLADALRTLIDQDIHGRIIAKPPSCNHRIFHKGRSESIKACCTNRSCST